MCWKKFDISMFFSLIKPTFSCILHCNTFPIRIFKLYHHLLTLFKICVTKKRDVLQNVLNANETALILFSSELIFFSCRRTFKRTMTYMGLFVKQSHMIFMVCFLELERAAGDILYNISFFCPREKKL